MEIPKQLKKNEFRFTRLKGKIPQDVAWQKDNNFAWDSKELSRHTENIGVVCGKGNLLVVDIDGNGEATLKKILETLPRTYTVKTGKQGYHLFYITDELIKGTAFDFNDSHIDIKADRGQVVMEGSIHPETKKKYMCHYDNNVVNIGKEDFEKVFKLRQENGITVKKKKQGKTIENDKTRSSTEFSEILRLLGKGKSKKEIFTHMAAYEKWNSSKDQYKEFSYNKAYTYMNTKKDEKVTRENISRIVLELLGDQNKDTAPLSRLTAEEHLVTFLKDKLRIQTIMQDEKLEMWGYEDGIYVNFGQSLAKEELRVILKKSFSIRIINNVLLKLQADTYISSKEFFKAEDPYLLPVANGLLDIKTLVLSEFTPDKVFFSKLPVAYNPHAECPAILEHLKSVLAKETDVELLQEAIGNCLLKKYTFQKSVMMVGSGRNGKGMTLQLLTHLLGGDNTTAVTLERLETDMYALSDLHGQLANIAGDLNKTSLRNTGQFKSATGGDLLAAPRKFMTPIEFENYAKFFFACNELPLIYDDTRGFWDRWIYFEFPYTFIPEGEYIAKEEKGNFKVADPLLKNKIFTVEEMEGFLVFALAGLSRLLKQNAFSLSETYESVKLKWENQSNSFKAFARKHIEVDMCESTDKLTLKHAYHNYCQFNKVKPMSEKAIFHILSTEYGADQKQVTQNDGNRIRVWDGVKVILPNGLKLFPEVAK